MSNQPEPAPMVAIVSAVASVYLCCPLCGDGVEDNETGSYLITADSTGVSCPSCDYEAAVPLKVFADQNKRKITRLQEKSFS